MGQESIQIKIKRDGTLEFTIKGVKGAKCEDIHKALVPTLQEPLYALQVFPKPTKFPG